MSEDEDIFNNGAGEETNSPVDVLKRALTLDDNLPIVCSNSSPKFYSVLFTKAAFCDKYRKGCREGEKGGDFRRTFGKMLLAFETSRRGKDNRADKVLDATKAYLQQMYEVERKAASRLMGST